jgi:hypothetical protein
MRPLTQIDHHVIATLYHPKDGRAFLLLRASTRFAFPSASTTWSARALDHLWLSFMPSNHRGFVALDLGG